MSKQTRNGATTDDKRIENAVKKAVKEAIREMRNENIAEFADEIAATVEIDKDVVVGVYKENGELRARKYTNMTKSDVAASIRKSGFVKVAEFTYDDYVSYGNGDRANGRDNVPEEFVRTEVAKFFTKK